jgi:hypothetical protein
MGSGCGFFREALIAVIPAKAGIQGLQVVDWQSPLKTGLIRAFLELGSGRQVWRWKNALWVLG